jgi:hypothetical protein
VTAWLWLFGCAIAFGACVTAAEAWAARRDPKPDPGEGDDADT